MNLLKKLILRTLVPVAVLCVALEIIGYLLTDEEVASEDSRGEIFSSTFYEPDPDLIRRLRPSLQSNFSLIREDIDVPVKINSEGFRGDDFSARDPDAYRVLVLGDSVSFGLYVRNEEAWPSLLAQSLQRAAAGKKVQVRNRAVPGYSSQQGRILFDRHVRDGTYEPHAVIFAFGYNDSFFRGIDDHSTQREHQFEYGSFLGAMLRHLKKSRFLRLILPSPKPLPDTGPCRVPQPVLEDILKEIVQTAAERHIDLILVNTNLPNSFARATFERVAAAHDLALADFRQTFHLAQDQEFQQPWKYSARLHLIVNTHGVEVPTSPDDRPRIYLLVVPDPSERDNNLRAVLSDDGVAPDQTADDGIWSVALKLPAGSNPEFALCVPGALMPSDTTILNGTHFRPIFPQGPAESNQLIEVEINALTTLASPWKDLIIDPDPIHASPAGCREMAAVVAEKLMASRSWARFLR